MGGVGVRLINNLLAFWHSVCSNAGHASREAKLAATTTREDVDARLHLGLRCKRRRMQLHASAGGAADATAAAPFAARAIPDAHASAAVAAASFAAARARSHPAAGSIRCG